MKKILIAASFCLASITGFSQQLLLKTIDGAVINNGDLFQFNQLTEPGNYLGLKIYNTSEDQDLMFKAKVISITNSNGTDLQLCVGDVCLSTITAGNSYPNFPPTLGPGEENSNFDHLLNNNPGINPNLPVEYVVKIYQVNEANQEIGQSVTFTYRYSATLGLGNFDLGNMGVAVKSNAVSTQLELRSSKNAQLSLFDINGKNVGTFAIVSGDNAVDVSNLSAGIYVANFSNEEGQKGAVKIIKK